MVDFAGWEMPVQYGRILDEHDHAGGAEFLISPHGEFSSGAACLLVDSLN
jgi:hypothetical protein